MGQAADVLRTCFGRPPIRHSASAGWWMDCGRRRTSRSSSSARERTCWCGSWMARSSASMRCWWGGSSRRMPSGGCAPARSASEACSRRKSRVETTCKQAAYPARWPCAPRCGTGLCRRGAERVSCTASEPARDRGDSAFGVVGGGSCGVPVDRTRTCLRRLKQRSMTMRCVKRSASQAPAAPSAPAPDLSPDRDHHPP